MATTCSAPDYLDDFVCSRTISIFSLIAVTFPFIQWVRAVIVNVKWIADQPIFYFLFYMALSLLIYVILIVPLQFGNKPSSKTKHKSFSILSCALLLLYNFFNSYAILDDNFNYWLLFVASSTSSVAALTIAVLYILSIFKTTNPFYLRKYEKLKLFQSQQKDTNSKIKMSADREIERGLIHSCIQFFWPTSDQEIHSKVQYPSRLFYAAYLSFIGITAVFLANYNLYIYIDKRLKDLKNSIDENQNNGRNNNKGPILIAAENMYEFGQSFNLGLFVGTIIAFLFGIFGIFLLFKAWDKKMTNLKNGTPTFRYDEALFPSMWTVKFMASLASYLVTGSILICLFFAVVIGVCAYPPFWSYVVEQWQYFCGYFGYLFVEYVILRYWIHSKIDLLNKHENVFNVVLIVSDFMYLPLALSYGFLRILFWLCFALFSFLRPDINIYPRGFEDWDMGHLTFVSTVKIEMDRQEKYIQKYEQMNSQHDEEDKIAVTTSNYHSLAPAKAIEE